MKIIIENLVFKGIHGLTEKEKISSQKFILNIEVETDKITPKNDSIEETIDYRKIRNIAENVILGPHQNLLETMSMQIAERILDDKKINKVKISISKPDIWKTGIPKVEIELCNK
jgi:dihydroneopterin aldolase